MNTFGRLFRVTTFGESHGPALGAVVDGCPARIPLAEADIQPLLDRRRPGTGPLVSPRPEADRVAILSGVFEGVTTGAPIALVVGNEQARSSDYDALREVYRPGHADITYAAKYGVRDHRGGGRSSGRETIGRVAAGAVALKVLSLRGIARRGPGDPRSTASRATTRWRPRSRRPRPAATRSAGSSRWSRRASRPASATRSSGSSTPRSPGR